MNYKEKFQYLKGNGTTNVRALSRNISISADTLYKFLKGMDVNAAKARLIEAEIDRLMNEDQKIKRGSPPMPLKNGMGDHRIQDIIALLREDPEGTEAVYHFLEAKKNFDRASKTMKQYLGKKLDVWFEFPSRGNGEKGDGPGT